jgi:hypothetical protein
MTMLQLVSFLFWLTAYVVIVVYQITAVEKRLRNLARREAIVSRTRWSIVHFLIGFLACSVLGAYVNIEITGDYRHGVGFLFQICGGVIGLAVPWLGLLWDKRRESE